MLVSQRSRVPLEYADAIVLPSGDHAHSVMKLGPHPSVVTRQGLWLRRQMIIPALSLADTRKRLSGEKASEVTGSVLTK